LDARRLAQLDTAHLPSAAIKAGLDASTRPRDLRGGFASLLICEGRNVIEVGDQLGQARRA